MPESPIGSITAYAVRKSRGKEGGCSGAAVSSAQLSQGLGGSQANSVTM
jgi:hypothetical protein